MTMGRVFIVVCLASSCAAVAGYAKKSEHHTVLERLYSEIAELQLGVEHVERETEVNRLLRDYDSDEDGKLEADDLMEAMRHGDLVLERPNSPTWVQDSAAAERAEAWAVTNEGMAMRAELLEKEAGPDNPPCTEACTCARPANYALSNVNFLLSFGTRGGAGGAASWHKGFIGFQRATKTCTELRKKKGKPAATSPGDVDFCYIDAVSLPTKPGVFKKGEQTLNCWWQDYYKNAMTQAPKMAFLLSMSWLLSKNCWEEWGWAIDQNLRGGKPTVLVAVDQPSKTLLTAMKSGTGLDAAVKAFIADPAVKTWADGAKSAGVSEADVLGFVTKMSAKVKVPPANLKILEPASLPQTNENDNDAKAVTQATALATAIAA